MTDFFGNITEGQNPLKKLLSKIPGFSGYIERENRRTADKLVRETVATAYEQLWQRTSNLQQDLISGGKILFVDDMEKAAIQLRTFTDKIRTASYGYSGFFDAVQINEAELEQLYNFDVAFFDVADQISNALDNVEASLEDEAGLPAAIRHLTSLAREATNTFNRRDEVITSGGSQ
jgi:hypothetical protein